MCERACKHQEHAIQILWKRVSCNPSIHVHMLIYPSNMMALLMQPKECQELANARIVLGLGLYLS